VLPIVLNILISGCKFIIDASGARQSYSPSPLDGGGLACPPAGRGGGEISNSPGFKELMTYGRRLVFASISPRSNWSDLRKKQGFGMESGELVS